MRESIVTLLAALLGAIVGGACTFLDTIGVSKWELARSKRILISEELIPRIRNQAIPKYRAHRSLENFISLHDEIRALLRATK